MAVRSFAQRDRLQQRISDLARDELDPTEYLDAVRTLIRGAVDYDSGYLAATDPATTLFSSAIVLEAYDGALCGPTLDNEFMDEDFNKFSDMHRNRLPATTLSDATLGRPDRSQRHRTINVPAGYRHELRAVFMLEGGCWGVLNLLRSDGEDFGDLDRQTIDLITPTVAAGIRGSVAGVRPHDHGPHVAPAVILMSPDGVVTSMTDRAAELAAELGHQSVDTGLGVALPGEAYVVGARARSRAAGVAGPDPIARVRGTSGGWLTVRGECTRDADGNIDHIALVLEPARTSEVLPLFVAAHGLSEREREVLGELVDGRSTAQIADVLFISPHTVRDHVKAIFAKVDVSSRGELLSRLYRLHYQPGLDVLHLD